jgi:uncharacterized cupin superfamily protein
VIAHWDDVTVVRRAEGHICGDWQYLTGDESVTIGARRLRVPAGSWSTPLHLEGSEEEIFFVLAGTGVSLQQMGGEEHAFAVGPGDCLVHLALVHAHTLQAGPDGLEVLTFGQRHYARNTLVPRAGVSWLGPTWVLQGAPEDHPFKREAAVGPPEVGELEARPSNIVNVEDVEPATRDGATVARAVRDLGRAAGSFATGLRLFDAAPGKLHAPPHCHSAEEEIFVVLEGEGPRSTPCGGEASSRAPRAPVSRTRSAAGREVSRSSRTEPATRATSPTTPGRARSPSGAWA